MKKKQMDQSSGSDQSTVEESHSSSSYSSDALTTESSKGSGTSGGSDDDGGSVRFALNNTAYHQVESRASFSSKERARYWWSDREKDRMLAKQERLVEKYKKQMSKKQHPSSSSKGGGGKKLHNYRGLESWTEDGSLKLAETIERCINAVMDEQDRQWDKDDDDADAIAKCSLRETEDSVRRARSNGLGDAEEAMRVMRESWALTSDDMSTNSALSTGTIAMEKKKKRSAVLERLDDSRRGRGGGAKNEDVLSSLNSSSSSKRVDKKSKKKSKAKKKKSKDTSSRKVSSSAGKTPEETVSTAAMKHVSALIGKEASDLNADDITSLIGSLRLQKQKQEAASWQDDATGGSYGSCNARQSGDPPGHRLGKKHRRAKKDRHVRRAVSSPELGENDTETTNFEGTSTGSGKSRTAVRRSVSGTLTHFDENDTDARSMYTSKSTGSGRNRTAQRRSSFPSQDFEAGPVSKKREDGNVKKFFKALKMRR